MAKKKIELLLVKRADLEALLDEIVENAVQRGEDTRAQHQSEMTVHLKNRITALEEMLRKAEQENRELREEAKPWTPRREREDGE